MEAVMRFAGRSGVRAIGYALLGALIGVEGTLGLTLRQQIAPLPVPPPALHAVLVAALLGAAGGALLAAWTTFGPAPRMRREIARAARSGTLPAGADPEEWARAVFRRRAELQRQRWLVPILLMVQVALIGARLPLETAFYPRLSSVVLMALLLVSGAIAVVAQARDRGGIDRLLARVLLARA